MKSVTVSKGNVKGGSITLGVTKASVGETVSFTTSPTSGFTYQGATVECEDTNKITIASTAKSFKTTSNCKSPIVWPSWKKDNYNIWEVNKVNNTGGMGSPKYDGARMTITWNSTSLNYKLASGADTRGQMSTVNSFDVTDYNILQGHIWCVQYSDVNFIFTIGLMKDKSKWITDTTADRVSNSVTWTNAQDKWLSVDIPKNSGNYYITSQLYANKAFNCDHTTMVLLGTTYGYGNTGL